MAMMVRRGLDLRMTQEDRMFYARPNTVVVLVNNAHTLCHIVLAEDPEFSGRRRIPKYLKGVTDDHLESFMRAKFDWLLSVKVEIHQDPVFTEDCFKSKKAFGFYSKRRRV